MAETELPRPVVVLRYSGGGAFLPGVPARDLTADDLAVIAEFDDLTAATHAEFVKGLPKDAEPPDAPARRDRKALLKSGLYEPVEVPAKEK